MTKPTQLYRHYDKDDNLLYVGISLSAYARLSQHKLHSEWASSAVTMTTEKFLSRQEALDAERQAIINEKPLFNVTHNTKEIDNNATNKELLSIFIECGGTQVTKFLAYLVYNCNMENEILGTQEILAVKAKVSISTVKKTMSILQGKGMIKKVHAGCYMLTPLMIRNGDTSKGAMLLRLWSDLK